MQCPTRDWFAFYAPSFPTFAHRVITTFDSDLHPRAMARTPNPVILSLSAMHMRCKLEQQASPRRALSVMFPHPSKLLSSTINGESSCQQAIASLPGKSYNKHDPLSIVPYRHSTPLAIGSYPQGHLQLRNNRKSSGIKCASPQVL